MHPVVIWPFIEAVRRLGVELPAELPSHLTAGGFGERVPHEQASLLLDWAIAFTGRVDLGLLAAEAVEPGHFELVELASRTQGTVGEGLATLAGLASLLHDGLSVKLVRGETTSRLRIELQEGLRIHPAGYDFIVASLLIAGRRQTGIADLKLSFIRLPYALPSQLASVAEHSLLRLVQCAIELDADVLEIGFPTAALEVPLMRANASMSQALQQAARELLPQAPAPSELAAVVQKLVREGLASGAIDTASVARKLHMSERTLRRKLEADGASLRVLIDDARKELALKLLLSDARSTDEVAAQLGFTTAQALHRAFRRWTGDTVQAFRAQKAARGPRSRAPKGS